MNNTPYDPGPLPTKLPPNPGDVIEFEVAGYPPYKDKSFSIRNPKHKDYSRFVNLRKAGIVAMNGRAWSHAPIRMDFALYAQGLEKENYLTMPLELKTHWLEVADIRSHTCQWSLKMTARYVLGTVALSQATKQSIALDSR